MNTFRVFILFLVLTTVGCKDCKWLPPPPPPPLPPTIANIQIVLDLSDRIIKSNDVFLRDTTIISSLYDIMLAKAKSEFWFQNNDNIEVNIAHQREIPYQDWINRNTSNLKINMREVSIDKKKELPQMKEAFMNRISELYAKANFSDRPNDYKGANIYSFIKDELPAKIISDTNINVVVILTDGELYASGLDLNDNRNWANINLNSNTHFYILEMIEGKNIDAYQDKEKYWTDKLKLAGVSQPVVISFNTHSIQDVIKDIRNVITSKDITKDKRSDSEVKQKGTVPQAKKKISSEPVEEPIDYVDSKDAKSIDNKYSGIYAGAVAGNRVSLVLFAHKNQFELNNNGVLSLVDVGNNQCTIPGLGRCLFISYLDSYGIVVGSDTLAMTKQF